MNTVRMVGSLALALSLTAVINVYGQTPQESSQVIARVSGADLTIADLQQKEGRSESVV